MSITVKTHRGPIEIEAGQPFAAAIKAAAAQVGLSVFRVWVNAEEILNEANAPATVEEGMAIGIQPDNIAA